MIASIELKYLLLLPLLSYQRSETKHGARCSNDYFPSFALSKRSWVQTRRAARIWSGFFSRSFDKESTGKISEKTFRTIMVNKDDVTEKDVEEMLDEYYRPF